jgi:hypothetical protein
LPLLTRSQAVKGRLTSGIGPTCEASSTSLSVRSEATISPVSASDADVKFAPCNKAAPGPSGVGDERKQFRCGRHRLRPRRPDPFIGLLLAAVLLHEPSRFESEAGQDLLTRLALSQSMRMNEQTMVIALLGGPRSWSLRPKVAVRRYAGLRHDCRISLRAMSARYAYPT